MRKQNQSIPTLAKVEEIANIILNRNPGEVVRYRLLRDVLCRTS